MKRLLPLAIVLLVAQSAVADDTSRWSIEFKGGRFKSEEARWAEFYGDDRFPAYAGAVGYRIFEQVEFVLEAGYLRDKGRGFAPGHGALAGTVRYQLFPVHLQVVLRGVFHPDQWLVPYVGAGASRLYYRVEPEGQSTVSGSADGKQYRAGLQLLLDNFDRRGALQLADAGIRNTYFFLEAQRIDASVNGTELGGRVYLGGIRFEF